MSTRPSAPLPAAALPRVLFVMGKGGVGRSTVTAALGLHLAAAGERVLLVEWTLEETIAPWFGEGPAGLDALTLAPGLAVCNFSLPDAIREYFVGHLGLEALHDLVSRSRAVQRMIEAVPGLGELMFLGRLFGLSTVSAQRPGELLPRCDRILVDAPATGYGASLFAVPSTFALLGAGGLLRSEVERVEEMLADPHRTGSVVVTLPEEMPAAETVELVPRLTRELGRPPLALFVNRSAAPLVEGLPAEVPGRPQSPRFPDWAAPLLPSIERPEARTALLGLWAEVERRGHHERRLRDALRGACPHGITSLDEQLLHDERADPLAVVRRLAPVVGAALGGRAVEPSAAVTP